MSTAKFNTLSNLAGSLTVPVATVVQGSAKAWVNFNGTGTVAIRAAFNVTSITDNGLSDYTVNFTTAMPDANFSTVLGGSFQLNSAGNAYTFLVLQGTFTVSSVRVSSIAPSTDQAYVCVSVFR